MTKDELAAYGHQLMEMANRLNIRVRSLRDDALRTTGNSDSDNLPTEQSDWSAHESEEERTLSVMVTEQQLLDEVQSALARVEDGSFGLCAKCKSAISKPRLAAVPYARHCISCANKEQVD